MKMVPSENLRKLGFSYSEQELEDSAIPDSCVPLRVTQVQKESYFVTDGKGEVYAEVTGRLLYGAESSLDLPVTGDWVMTQVVDSNLAIIHKVLPRKSLLKRKSAGKKSEHQAIASNIDIAFLVQAVDDDFSLRRLERYLVMCREGDIQPVIVLSKIDLVEPEELIRFKSEAENIAPNVTIFAISSDSGEGVEALDSYLKPATTYCLLGSSGVGKSTLLNRLAGEDLMETKEIRESDSKGRHTTTTRHLLVLESGVVIVDTPGMRELANVGAESGLSETFADIEDLAAACKFSDCEHNSEVGCAILDAVEKGELEEDRFHSYLKLRKESEHYERSFLEKKQHDKSLGKLYKSVQQNNRKLKNN